MRGFGPGLVSGASANDPTTVGSIAVVAAATGYRAAWIVVLLLPMLALVQSIAASVAAVSQMNVQQAIVQAYGRRVAFVSAAAIAIVILITLGADIRAGAQALALLVPVPAAVWIVPLVAAAGWVLGTRSYLRIERILAAFSLIFVCYVAAALVAKPDWRTILHAVVVPHLDASAAFLGGAIALLGTTLTSYVYVWESIEVAERRPAPFQLGAVKADAVIGMLVAGSSFFFIFVATATVAGRNHLPIVSAADAAVALKPLAGSWDEILFGAGLLASAAIAIPVLAATNGYAIANTLGWRTGLGFDVDEARSFYAAIGVTLVAGGVLAFLPIPTMAFLYWASIAGGLATPVTLCLLLLLARHPTIMRGQPLNRATVAAGWAVTAAVGAAAIAFILAALGSGH